MAAPSTTTRQTPAGILMENGFSTKIAFARDPDVSFWEVTVQPPSLDGGDAINRTNMHNVTVRTMAARSLYTLGEHTATAFYDPNVYNNIKTNLLNKNGSVTVSFPDGSTLDYYAYLRVFAPDAHEEGAPPTATITITPTNWDPVNNVEAVPVLTSVTGT